MHRNDRGRGGFTLIEILVVIAVICILASIIFPAMAKARERGRQTACASNLRQLGMSLSMYADDSDQLYPRGGDAVDLNTNNWNTVDGGDYASDVKKLPALPDLLFPYTKSKTIWRCPDDNGGSFVDGSSDAVPLPASSSYFERYGLSYIYRTELGLKRKTISETVGYDPAPPYAQHGIGDINVLFDDRGDWHGSSSDRRYNVLMGDGRVKSMTVDQLDDAWSLTLAPHGGS